MAQVKCSFYLLGKTGTGKSSTGNTIVGHKVFKASPNSTASTTTTQKEKAILNDSSRVEIVDGPGLVGLDSGFSQLAINSFREEIDLNPRRGHIFLIVCRYGERFTAEDSCMVDALRKEFGSDVFANHGIVVVTCGNNFVVDYEEDKDVTFESWCRDQGGDFGKLVQACGGRIILVDNSPSSNGADELAEKLPRFMQELEYGQKSFKSSTDIWNLIKAFVVLVKPYKKLISGLCVAFIYFIYRYMRANAESGDTTNTIPGVTEEL